MRCFLALDIPNDIRGRLAVLVAGCRTGHVLPAESYHITLAFIDELPEHMADDVHRELAGMPQPGFQLQLTGLGVFGGDIPRTLYAAVQPNPELSDLRRRLRRAVRNAGIALPRERFVPHVTLARYKRDQAAAANAEIGALMARHTIFPLSPFPAGPICFYRSFLRPGGAVHELLASYPADL